jgi:hypothetical protein
MRASVAAAFTAAAIIGAFTWWRLSGREASNPVDEAAMIGSWTLSRTEACTPPLPERVTLGPGGAYSASGPDGAWSRDAQGAYTIRIEGQEFPNHIFRAESDRLEILNPLGCKAVYEPAEE